MFVNFLYKIQTTPPRTSAALKSIKKKREIGNSQNVETLLWKTLWWNSLKNLNSFSLKIELKYANKQQKKHTT